MPPLLEVLFGLQFVPRAACPNPLALGKLLHDGLGKLAGHLGLDESADGEPHFRDEFRVMLIASLESFLADGFFVIIHKQVLAHRALRRGAARVYSLRLTREDATETHRQRRPHASLEP